MTSQLERPPLFSKQQAPILAAAVAVCVFNGVFACLAWLEQDLLAAFGWLLPLTIGAMTAAIGTLLSKRETLDARWLGRGLAAYAITVLLEGWLYIPVLWEEAHRLSRSKAYGPVHGIMVEGHVRVFHELVGSIAWIWMFAALASLAAAALLRSRLSGCLVALSFLHLIGCILYAIRPLD